MNDFSILIVGFTTVMCYLFGAIPFGLIIARIAGVEDIRNIGSGNIGATNVWRAAGAKVAIWVFACDIGKGVAAVLLARMIFLEYPISIMSKEFFLALCGMAAVLGHIFPAYLKFIGGKGVNTALGVVISLLPIQTLISFGVFVVTLFLSRYVSLGSILAAVALTVILLLQKFVFSEMISTVYVVLSVFLSAIVIFSHRQNIVRIISGSENKFSFSANAPNTK